MITIMATYETQDELNLLQDMAKKGHKIFTLLNGKPVMLLDNNEARKMTNFDYNSFVQNFHLDSENKQDSIENIAPNVIVSPITSKDPINDKELGWLDNGKLQAKFDEYDTKFDVIIQALKKPILEI